MHAFSANKMSRDANRGLFGKPMRMGVLALLILSVVPGSWAEEPGSSDLQVKALQKIKRVEPTSPVRYETWKKDPKVREQIASAVSMSFPPKLETLKALDAKAEAGDPAAQFICFSRPYALAYQQIANLHEFRKEILIPWAGGDESKWGEDLLWVIPLTRLDAAGSDWGCPILHATADVPSDRLKFFLHLRAYYLEVRKKPEIWKDIIDSKNTAGYTFLDYIKFREDSGRLPGEQKAPLAELKAVLLKDGAVHSIYARKP